MKRTGLQMEIFNNSSTINSKLTILILRNGSTGHLSLFHSVASVSALVLKSVLFELGIAVLQYLLFHCTFFPLSSQVS